MSKRRDAITAQLSSLNDLVARFTQGDEPDQVEADQVEAELSGPEQTDDSTAEAPSKGKKPDTTRSKASE
jgi:hypothetical protein